jgi:hypothetical protein
MSHRTLALHAAAVGGGWFVLAFVSLVVVLPARPEWIGSLPKPIQGAGLTLIAVVAVPLAWPIYLALGMSEARLAERIRLGDVVASRVAGRLLRVQAGVFAIASLGAGVAAISLRAMNGAGYLALAWLPLAAIAGAHAWTARRIISP